MTAPLDDREARLFETTEPAWIERWRDATGGLTVARLSEGTSLVMFAGKPTDEGADWLAEHLPRLLDGEGLHHFIDQGLLDQPNTKIRNLYMSTLKRRYKDIARVHIFVGDKPLLKMITSAANMVFGGLGTIHDEVESFDAALRERG